MHVMPGLVCSRGNSCIQIINCWVSNFTFSTETLLRKQKQKNRGMFETQKKTSSRDIGLIIRTLASPKVGQDQVSRGVSVLCWHVCMDEFYIIMFEIYIIKCIKYLVIKARKNVTHRFSLSNTMFSSC